MKPPMRKESRRLPERPTKQSLNSLGKNRGPGQSLPPLYDGSVGRNKECGGNHFDSELAGNLTLQVDQQREVEMPVVSGVENGIVGRLRAGCENRGIDDGDSQSAGAVLLSHADKEYDLPARISVGGVGDRLQERQEERLRGLNAKRKCTAANDWQSEIGQSGDGL